MPNRIIRESILTSEPVDALNWQEEVFYRRLLSKVDDYGRFDARPSILRTSLFPLRVDRVREADCTRWLAACQAAGLIVLYGSADRPVLEATKTKWLTRTPSKYPAPPLQTLENICPQVQTNARLVVDVGVVVDDVEQDDAPPSAAPPAKGDAKATRLAAHWLPTPEQVAWAKAKRPELDVPEEAEKFRDYWQAQPGVKGRKTDWPATWRNWIRGARLAGTNGFTPAPIARNPVGSSPVITGEEAKRREADALAEMKRQYPEMFDAK